MIESFKINIEGPRVPIFHLENGFVFLGEWDGDNRKIPYKEGPLDERDIDLLLIKMVGADNTLVRDVLDDPALRKAARALAGRKQADGPPDAREAILSQVQRAANTLVDNLRHKAKTEREVVTAEEKVLIVRQQIDSLLGGVEKVA